MISKIKEFVKAQEVNIILGIGVVLISLISFAAGYLVAREQLRGPIRINESSMLHIRILKTTVSKNLQRDFGNCALGSLPSTQTLSARTMPNCLREFV